MKFFRTRRKAFAALLDLLVTFSKRDVEFGVSPVQSSDIKLSHWFVQGWFECSASDLIAPALLLIFVMMLDYCINTS